LLFNRYIPLKPLSQVIHCIPHIPNALSLFLITRISMPNPTTFIIVNGVLKIKIGTNRHTDMFAMTDKIETKHTPDIIGTTMLNRFRPIKRLTRPKPHIPTLLGKSATTGKTGTKDSFLTTVKIGKILIHRINWHSSHNRYSWFLLLVFLDY